MHNSAVVKNILVIYLSFLIILQFHSANGQFIEDNRLILGLWRLSRGMIWNSVGESGKETHKIGNKLQVFMLRLQNCYKRVFIYLIFFKQLIRQKV